MLDDLIEFWREAADAGCEIHPKDRLAIERSRHRLPDARIPEPWFGIPRKAKIFYLTLHPSHIADDGSEKPPWRGFCRNMMREDISYDCYKDTVPNPGYKWFQRVHGGFSDHTFPWICNLRLIAYPSANRGAFGKILRDTQSLPSTEIMIRTVHHHLVPRAQAGEILLLAMMSPKIWDFDQQSEDRWENGLFISKPTRMVSISPTSRVGSKIEDYLNQCGAMR